MLRSSFIIHIKIEDFHEGIAKDIEKQFDTSYYDEDECNFIGERPLPIGKNKKVIGFFND